MMAAASTAPVAANRVPCMKPYSTSSVRHRARVRNEFSAINSRKLATSWTVTSQSSNDVNPFKNIQVEPLVDFSSLQSVIVLVPKR